MAIDVAKIYGTSELPTPSRLIRCGALSMSIEAGMLRYICWNGVELIQAISFPIRNSNWGTIPLIFLDETHDSNNNSINHTQKFKTLDDSLEGTFSLTASSSGLMEVCVTYSVLQNTSVSRAGFTILHPINRLTSSPINVTHHDNTHETLTLSKIISPSQPIRDIKKLAYTAHNQSVAIAMFGDVFEMEDQRNWTDASFKTYCRPLSLPYPFSLLTGEHITQTLVIEFSGEKGAHLIHNLDTSHLKHSLFIKETTNEKLPEVLLVSQPQWKEAKYKKHGWGQTPIQLPELAGLKRNIRLDLREGEGVSDILSDISPQKMKFDLELITSDKLIEAKIELNQLAKNLHTANLYPDHIIALPAAYLQSYQPDADWPTGVTPSEIIEAARDAFKDVKIGGGMLTNFTELNRQPPKVDKIDYITHSTTAIVHASDDMSVIETLQTLPHIFYSAQKLAPSKPYRLGLLSIGMRSNPYGTAVADNPESKRTTMATNDPRHKGLFGAAWLVGVVAATQGYKIEAMALGATSGPFSLGEYTEDNNIYLYPSFHIIRTLSRMESATRLSAFFTDPNLRTVAVQKKHKVMLLIANLSNARKIIVLPKPAHSLCLDTDSISAASINPDWSTGLSPNTSRNINVPPFATVFSEMEW